MRPGVRECRRGRSSRTVPDVASTGDPAHRGRGNVAQRVPARRGDGLPPVVGVLLVARAVAAARQLPGSAARDGAVGGHGERADALRAEVQADPHVGSRHRDLLVEPVKEETPRVRPPQAGMTAEPVLVARNDRDRRTHRSRHMKVLYTASATVTGEGPQRPRPYLGRPARPRPGHPEGDGRGRRRPPTPSSSSRSATRRASTRRSRSWGAARRWTSTARPSRPRSASARTRTAGSRCRSRSTASLPHVDQEAADRIVAAAHQVCPYSNATRGNIDVTVRAIGR